MSLSAFSLHRVTYLKLPGHSVHPASTLFDRHSLVRIVRKCCLAGFNNGF
jgi:hypothetical protein